MEFTVTVAVAVLVPPFPSLAVTLAVKLPNVR
jgi:hypothetical protein